jgi:hypothetical protein
VFGAERDTLDSPLDTQSGQKRTRPNLDRPWTRKLKGLLRNLIKMNSFYQQDHIVDLELKKH